MTAQQTISSSALAAWEQIKAGERVVVSDETLDAIASHLSPQDTDEAALYFGRCASIPNPNRLGVRDQYVAFLKPEEPAKDCPHPPARLYSWHAADGVLCVACCECGRVLKGGVK